MKKLTIISLIAIAVLSCSKNNVPDTIKWINGTYAVLTYADKGNFNDVGGFLKNDSTEMRVKKLLDELWKVNDPKSAKDTIEWLLNGGGHRQSFLDTVYEIGLDKVLDQNELDGLTDELKESDRSYINMMYKAYMKYGDNAIDAWDLCRANQLLGYYYIAGYYTYEEALDKALSISKTIQETYSSWEDMAESYLYGYQYWQEDDINDKNSPSYARYKIYEKVKKAKNSPYKLNWNLDLKREW